VSPLNDIGAALLKGLGDAGTKVDESPANCSLWIEMSICRILCSLNAGLSRRRSRVRVPSLPYGVRHSEPDRVAGDPGTLVGRRVPPPAGARPLVAPVPTRVFPRTQESSRSSDLAQVHASRKRGRDQTLSPENCPILTEVSGVKGGQDQTKETPPNPLKGGSCTTRCDLVRARRADRDRPRERTRDSRARSRASPRLDSSHQSHRPPRRRRSGPSHQSVGVPAG
jgi:hypothetical protein